MGALACGLPGRSLISVTNRFIIRLFAATADGIQCYFNRVFEGQPTIDVLVDVCVVGCVAREVAVFCALSVFFNSFGVLDVAALAVSIQWWSAIT